MPDAPHQNSVETGYWGHYVNVLEPDPATIALEDVAFMLALTNRFNGATGIPAQNPIGLGPGRIPRGYSVAQHAVFVSRRIEQKGGSPRQQLGGLHHDDPEYVLNDIVRPVKPLLGDVYADLTRGMEQAVLTALGLPLTPEDLDAPIVKAADRFSVFCEARTLLPSEGRGWTKHADYWDIAEDVPERIVIPGYYTRPVSPARAMRQFLSRHRHLMEAL